MIYFQRFPIWIGLLGLIALFFSCSDLNPIKETGEELIRKELDYHKAIADSLYYSGQMEKAKDAYLQTAQLAKRNGKAFLQDLSDNLADAAFCLNESDKYNEAISLYLEAIKYADKENHPESVATIYSNMGVAQMLKSDYPGALESFMAALKIDEDIFNIKEISTDYNNLGKLYEAWKNYPLARQYYQKALEIDVANNDSAKIPIRLNSIGMVFKATNQPDSSLVYIFKALDIDEKLSNQRGIATRKSNIGQILNETGRYHEAENFLVQALTYFKQKNIEKSMAITQNALGDVYTHKLNFKEALKQYHESLTISEQIGYLIITLENYKDLAYIHKKLGKFKEAFDYFEKSKILGDSLFTSDNQKLINEYHIKYETELKERKLQQQKLELQKSNSKILLISIIGSAFLIVSLVLIRIIRFKRKTSKLLESQNIELACLNDTKNKLFSIIAHDLKNNVSGIYNLSTALNQNFEHIPLPELKNYVARIENASINLRALLINLLQWAMGQSKSIKIHPSRFSMKDLVNSVTYQLSAHSAAKSIEIKVFGDDFEMYSDKQLLQTVLYNILGNAIKFSGLNSLVEIAFKNHSDIARFEVKDYGIGMNPEELEKLLNAHAEQSLIRNSPESGTGLGLPLCKELVRLLGGSISATSEKNKGSRFIIQIPVLKDGSEQKN
jgi:signal transduction histidine kinase/Tfp pilus assembly protein PilF